MIHVPLLFRDSLMFWSDIENDIIYRANFDGTQKEVLVDTNILVVGKFTLC